MHWITHVCPKPWRVADAAEPLEDHCDAAVYAYWRRVWNRLTTSSKDESTGGSVGSLLRARPGREAPPGRWECAACPIHLG